MNAHLINLASARLGARAVDATDDFFADKSRLLSDAEPVFVPGRYDDNGKWMDGWESRRRRGRGHDHCTVKLACVGSIEQVEIDTRHFTGNYAPAASLEACLSDEESPGDDAGWQEIAPVTSLAGDERRTVAISAQGTWSHVRLHIYPDGGVARLRIHGRPRLDAAAVAEREIDLAASLNGALAMACNDEHFGSMQNLLAPGRGVDMGDGWETRRRREPGYDWVIVRLAHTGSVSRIEVDTAHFKGNYPDRCSIQAACVARPDPVSIAAQSLYWPTLLPEQALTGDRVHEFRGEIRDCGPVNCIRLNIIPDGGVSRLRVFGRLFDLPVDD
ncbi:MAG: allantoicase [Proteobacteria bacterium]|nr:MAG: allantoicase [Pseudomonadota bacterium]